MSGGYIPTMWAPKLLIKFYEKTVMSDIANTDYEGVIANQGDTVTINERPTITINDYVKGQELDIEHPDPDNLTLTIDKGKSYSFAVNDVDSKQSIIKFTDDWTDDASRNLKISIETGIFADIYSDADSTNAGASAGAISGDIDLGVAGTPIALTSANIVEHLLNMGICLDENNVPDENRWALLPAWACARLKDSDIKDASLTGDSTSPIRNGMIGKVDRFKIYNSNLVHNSSGEFDIMAGHTSALTFAAQITKAESARIEKGFGTLFKGLTVYGYEVVKPTALVHSVVDKS